MPVTLETLVFLIIAVVFLIVLLVTTYKKLRAIRKRFQPVISVEEEVEKLTNKRNAVIKDTEKLKADYTEKRTIFDRLKKELASYDEKLSSNNILEMGIYEPHFDFTDTEEFKQQIKYIREEQKSRVKSKTAVTCNVEWTVEGSKAKGKTMTNRNIRLTLRAFNNECEAAVANTRWNNVNVMENRIIRASEQIDKMNASNAIIIEQDYIDLKLQELYLTHEYREMLQEEKEKRREQARLEREEKKLIEEAKAAAKEEEKYRKLLEKANEEAKKAVEGEDTDKLQSRIAELERSLQEANEKKERALSMAEQTKVGHVYVISNIGSFGENVVKIGMTRRLNPEERVKELGDASVPFVFDTHAMIYTEDAPAMENELHKRFHVRRVNAVNMRKEFFRVGLDEVASTIKEFDPNASFVMEREARDYMETLAVQRQGAETLEEDVEDEFPMSL